MPAVNLHCQCCKLALQKGNYHTNDHHISTMEYATYNRMCLCVTLQLYTITCIYNVQRYFKHTWQHCWMHGILYYQILSSNGKTKAKQSVSDINPQPHVLCSQEGVEVRVARIFNTFGSRMHMNDGRVVSNFILQALQGEPLTVRVFNSLQYKQFDYGSF